MAAAVVHQVQTQHLGCWWSKDATVILEELLRTNGCLDMGGRHHRFAQAGRLPG